MSKRFIINKKPGWAFAKVCDIETKFEILCYDADKVCEYLNNLVEYYKQDAQRMEDRKSSISYREMYEQ